MRDVDVCVLWVSGRSLSISTRHFLRLCLGVFGEPGVFFLVEMNGVVLSSDCCVALLFTVMVGTVVGAVCMGLAKSSMVCRVGKGPVS